MNLVNHYMEAMRYTTERMILTMQCLNDDDSVVMEQSVSLTQSDISVEHVWGWLEAAFRGMQFDAMADEIKEAREQ
jgi:hypothetical protein